MSILCVAERDRPGAKTFFAPIATPRNEPKHVEGEVRITAAARTAAIRRVAGGTLDNHSCSFWDAAEVSKSICESFSCFKFLLLLLKSAKNAPETLLQLKTAKSLFFRGGCKRQTLMLTIS